MINRKNKLLWKSMMIGMRSAHGNIEWKIGKWVKEDAVKLCDKGLHASEKIIDAMRFVNAEIIAQVEVKGKRDIQPDKQCWTEMRIVKAYEWTKEDSVRLAVYAAELVIDIFEKQYPNDKLPRELIKTAKKWLKEPTEEDRNASASYAAYYAASAVSSAAYSASSSAVAYAAYYAAYYAASASSSAAASSAASSAVASSAIKNKCEKFVLSILKNKKPIT